MTPSKDGEQPGVYHIQLLLLFRTHIWRHTPAFASSSFEFSRKGRNGTPKLGRLVYSVLHCSMWKGVHAYLFVWSAGYAIPPHLPSCYCCCLLLLLWRKSANIKLVEGSLQRMISSSSSLCMGWNLIALLPSPFDKTEINYLNSQTREDVEKERRKEEGETRKENENPPTCWPLHCNIFNASLTGRWSSLFFFFNVAWFTLTSSCPDPRRNAQWWRGKETITVLPVRDSLSLCSTQSRETTWTPVSLIRPLVTNWFPADLEFTSCEANMHWSRLW